MLEVGPQKVEGEYFYPLRFIAERMGHRIYWMPGPKTALVRGQGRNLEITNNSKTYKSGGVEKTLKNAPYIYHEKMLIPQEIMTQELGLPITKEDGYNIYMSIDPDLLKPWAVNFTLPDMDGNQVNLLETLAKSTTKCILINFWSSRCDPCKKEMPELVKLHNKYKDNGLVVLGVCTDSSNLEADRDDLIEKLKITYTILLDPLAESYYKWGGLNVPNMSIVSKEGLIIYQHDGYSPQTAIEAEKVIKKELGLN
jgi:peroxiredoxin